MAIGRVRAAFPVMMLCYGIALSGCGDDAKPSGPRFADVPVNAVRYRDREMQIDGTVVEADQDAWAAGTTLELHGTYRMAANESGDTAGTVELRRIDADREVVVSSSGFYTQRHSGGKWRFHSTLPLPDEPGEYVLVVHMVGDDLLFENRRITVVSQME